MLTVKQVCFQSCTEMYTGAHERAHALCVNIILWQRFLQRKTNVCFLRCVSDIFECSASFCKRFEAFCILCAILGFVCKVLKM